MKINIGPVTRLEGHLSIDTTIRNNIITDARAHAEMYRGFEVLLQGRDPMDAQQITQRICGVCPYAHGIASSYAQENAYRITAEENGRILHNLIQGANHLYDYLLHFYQLAALDFIDITAILDYSGKDPGLLDIKAWVKLQVKKNKYSPGAPFLPRLSGRYINQSDINIGAIKNYVTSLQIQQKANKACAIFGGKFPHSTTIFPTGVTQKITVDYITKYQNLIQEVRQFIIGKYLVDLEGVAAFFPEYWNLGKTKGGFLSYGLMPLGPEKNAKRLFAPGVLFDSDYESVNFDHIQEFTKYSRYSSPSGLKVRNGKSQPDSHKRGAYSWAKAPRYNKKPMEVGPAARVLVDYFSGNNKTVTTLVDTYCKKLNIKPENLNSVLGRHLCRGVCAVVIADHLLEICDNINLAGKTMKQLSVPESGQGFGVTEASRGALMHYIDIRGHKIHNYQCVVPTTWNISPRDDDDIPGPIETALIGTQVSDRNQQIEAGRIIRSFDPCLACSVH